MSLPKLSRDLVKNKICGFSIFLISLLSACGSTEREVNREVGEVLNAELASVQFEGQAGIDQVDWLDTFDDPVLIELVEEALQNNRNLQAAAASVDRARALAVQAGAGLTPSVSLAAGADRSGVRTSGTDLLENVNSTIQLNWELDLWGRVRSGSQAAAASVEAAEADFKYTQHSLAATAVKAYLIVVESSLQVEVTRDILESLLETLRIVELRYENGLASSLDLSLTRSDLASARERLTTIEGSQREALRALEVLLGRYPSAELDVEDTLPNISVIPVAGVSSELLQRRPDMIAAERRVAAAFNSLNQAEAARLPAISLTSSIGGSSSALSSLLDGGNVAWRSGVSLLTPLIDNGVSRSQVEIANAEQEQAIAMYAQAALDAFNEVETFLDSGVILQLRLDEIENANRENDEAYRIADLRYREGETDILDVLNIQNRVSNSRSSLVSLRRAQLEQRVNLFLALGGDWN